MLLLEQKKFHSLNFVALSGSRALPIGEDGTHYSSDGYIMLGKIMASAVEEFYKTKPSGKQ